jgi:hypothetical protein
MFLPSAHHCSSDDNVLMSLTHQDNLERRMRNPSASKEPERLVANAMFGRSCRLIANLDRPSPPGSARPRAR